MKLKSILDEFGDKLKEDLRKNLIAKGVEYDQQESALGASIVFYYSERNGNPVFNLSMKKYWEVVDEGRGANKKAPPTDDIEKWIERKGIKVEISNKKKKVAKLIKNKIERKSFRKQSREKAIKAMAFAMARSIGKKGTKATHFATELLEDGRIEKLNADLSKLLKAEIIVQFKKDE